MKFAKALVKLNIATFQVTNILGFNSVSCFTLFLATYLMPSSQPEWFVANTGSILAGCIAAGIYITNPPDACRYISDHSKAQVVVVEGNKHLQKYAEIASTLPHLKAIVVWGEPIDQSLASKITTTHIFCWDDFLNIGSELTDSVVNPRWASIRPGNCCTLIYTSGTTGPPKAVMISHDNLTWTARNIIEHYMDANHEDRAVSYLPLSHIAAQLNDIHCVMALGASIWFAQPDALKGSLTSTLKEVRPTFFFAVPRVWEKIQEKMIQSEREANGVLKVVSSWAKYMGKEKSKHAQFGEDGGSPCCFSCANILVLQKVKEALGLDQAKSCFTAAAPISPETLWYFASLDIPVYEVFGQSESTGPHTISAAKRWKIGSCGRPIYGSESRLDQNNGELCYRGRHIFMGYMNMEKETQETIDSDGYVHSGDMAEFDNNDDPKIVKPSGFMQITGRIKDLIITAGGENVPPTLIEKEMKEAMPAVSHVIVIGDKRKFLTMLISLKVEMESETGLPTEKLAADSIFEGQQIGSSAQTYTEAKNDPKWKEYVDKAMKVGNSKAGSNAQIVQKWGWLPQDFSVKTGELTPTLKLKRNVVTEKYSDLIESMYACVEDKTRK